MPKCLECGAEVARLQWTHFKFNCSNEINSLEEYKIKYPNALLVDADLIKKSKLTLTNMIYKYGKIEDKQRWNSYRKKQAISNSYEYKKEKYEWTEEEFNKFNKSRAITLSNLIDKYGIDEGHKKWESYIEKQRYTNSKEYFIKNYGEDGEQKWLQYNKDKSKSSDISFIMERYNVTEIDALEILSERFRASKFFSNAEKEFVELFENQIGHSIEYTLKTKQYSIWNYQLHCINFYDITDTNKMKIIEFNGDYWHCNPEKYKKDFFHSQSGQYAYQIWQHDEQKIKTAIDRGFNVKIVWWSEFINNQEKTLTEVIKWWNHT